MESEKPAIRTETKYQVSSCYFCNEFLDNNDFKAHLDKCGQALQKCPNDCLAYIQRKFLEQHLHDCPKKSNGNHNDTVSIRDDEIFALEQNITALRNALHEEIRQQHRLIADIGTLRKQFADETKHRVFENDSFREQIADLSRQCEEVKEWRKELRLLLDRFHQDLEFRNEATLSFEVLFSERDKTASKLHSLETEIDTLKMEQVRVNDSMTTTPNNSSLESDYRVSRSLERARMTVDRCRRCTFLEWKLSESLVELRQMKNTVYESEVKCEKSQKSVRDTQKLCAHTKQTLADLQAHLTSEKRMRTITNCEGHLIWRIDQFAAKFKDAKDNDTTIRSPMFCNVQYGYTLRLDVILNGLGKWKGRNMLSCLTVVSGEWDALLPWPCKLKADIILRNQSRDSASPNISKTIVVKKHDADYEQNQYIFISHRTIQNEDFLKNDCIFFEVFVHDSRDTL